MTPLTLSLLTFVALLGLIGAAAAVAPRSRADAAPAPPEEEDVIELRPPPAAGMWQIESRARGGL